MKIAVLYGGRSGEHEVSLVSATHIVRNLAPEHRLILIGISRDGRWFLQADSLVASCREDEATLNIRTDAPMVMAAPGYGLKVFGKHGMVDLQLDLVFPVLHGSFGEDGTVQGLLECSGLPYVGADVAGSAIGMSKDLSKKLWQAAGLPVVPFITVDHKTWQEKPAEQLAAEAVARFGWPLFVKPAGTGSSVGTSKATDHDSFIRALDFALRFDTKALIEPFISAREIECAVLGNDAIQSFAPGEVIPQGNHVFYDYDAKYTDPDGAILQVPARLEPAERDEVMRLALEAYRIANLSGMARIDFFIDRATGKLLLNEANTIPGFTPISLYPRMCADGGLSYPELLEKLMDLALERHKLRSSLEFTPHGKPVG